MKVGARGAVGARVLKRRMEGVHEGARHATEHIVGSTAVARAQRQRAQTGVAAEGRTGTRVAAAIRRDDQARVATMEESEVAAEVSRATTGKRPGLPTYDPTCASAFARNETRVCPIH